jgi:hypothetical protein
MRSILIGLKLDPPDMYLGQRPMTSFWLYIGFFLLSTPRKLGDGIGEMGEKSAVGSKGGGRRMGRMSNIDLVRQRLKAVKLGLYFGHT